MDSGHRVMRLKSLTGEPTKQEKGGPNKLSSMFMTLLGYKKYRPHHGEQNVTAPSC